MNELFSSIGSAMVPTSSMVGMWVYIGAILVAIVAVFWIFGHRVEMNVSTMVLGLVTYFVFDAVLLNMFFDNLIVGTFSAGLYDTVTSNPTAFVFYYSFTRGIFYLLGMYVCSRMSMRMDTCGGGCAMGIGWIAGFGIMNQSQGAWTVFQTWRSALAVNKNGGSVGYLNLMRSEGADAEQIEEAAVAVDKLVKTDVSYYLVSTLETLLLLGTLFAMAVIIHLAVTRRAPKSYLIVAIVLFIVAMVPTSLYLSAILTSRVIYDVLLVLICGGCIALAAVLGKKYMNRPMEW